MESFTPAQALRELERRFLRRKTSDAVEKLRSEILAKTGKELTADEVSGMFNAVFDPPMTPGDVAGFVQEIQASIHSLKTTILLVDERVKQLAARKTWWGFSK